MHGEQKQILKEFKAALQRQQRGGAGNGFAVGNGGFNTVPGGFEGRVQLKPCNTGNVRFAERPTKMANEVTNLGKLTLATVPLVVASWDGFEPH